MSSDFMRVLVTGGAGFIGSHTTDMLIEKGYDVRIMDNLENQVHQNKKPDHLNSSVEFVSGDINDKNLWRKVLSGVDAVIHLAAMVGVGQSMYQPVRYIMANTVGTANMYEVILENPELKKQIQKIVVASSKSIYGEGAYKCKTHGTIYPNYREISQLEKGDWEVHCPSCGEHVEPVGVTEEKPVQNISIYALSKYDTERVAIDFGIALGIPTVAFRYFNVYGPRQSLSNPYTGVIAIFLSRLKNSNPPIVYEDGNQLRDFIYIEDIARVNTLALESDSVTADVFNVGSGRPTSLNRILELLSGLTGINVDSDITKRFRPGDNRHDFSDISKINKKLGYKPKFELKEGLRRLIEWSGTQEAIDKFNEAEEERRKYFG